MKDLSQILQTQQVLSSGDASKVIGQKRNLKLLVENGKLQSLGRGYYFTAGLERWEALVLLVAKYFPTAVIAGKAALKLHGLYPSDPAEVEVHISRTTNQKNSLLKFSRVSDSRLVGITKIKFYGMEVRVYDPERSLAELYLNKSSRKLAKDALQAYLQKPKIDLDKVRGYDAQLKLEVMNQLEKIRLDLQYVANKKKAEPLEEEKGVFEHILGVAVANYSLKGLAGLGMKEIAEEAGVSVATVSYHFPNRGALQKAVSDAYEAKCVAAGAELILSPTLDPREYISRTTEFMMNLADADEMGFRLQKWSIADRNPYSLSVIEKFCSGFVALTKSMILAKVPGISSEEAEIRAVMYGSIMDQYSDMKWFYGDLLRTEMNKNRMLELYRQMIKEDIADMLFAPPRR